MDNIAKINFLTKLAPDNISMAEIIKKHKLWKESSYNNITKINAANTNSIITLQDVFNTYKAIYDYWYDYLTTINLNKFNSEQSNKIQKFLLMEKYKKQNMTAEDCYRFIHYEYDKLLEGVNVRPAQTQHNNQPLITTNWNVTSDFMHCMPFGFPSDISCRLYLNIKTENICELSEKLMKKCFDNRLKVYFKFWTKDNRNDKFLIYTDYEHIEDMIRILKQIKKENPKIFEGCENINPLLTNIDNFIGFGEEPEYKHTSFNGERCRAIDEFSRDVVGKEIINERKRIGHSTNLLLTSTGEKMFIDEYLVYRLEKSFRETIIEHHNDIMNGKYPMEYIRLGNNAISSYIDMENNIYRTCMNGLPPFVKQQIQEQAKRYLEGLKNGYNVFIEPIKFPTYNLDLFSPEFRDDLNNDLNNNGHLDYKFYINIDLQEKLFSVFGSNKRIESVITDEALAPYLERHHISPQHISLNTETERLLAQQNCYGVN